MTTLQITMLCIWITIGCGVLYSIGSAFGGAKAGLELILCAVCYLATWAAGIALLYFTFKALTGS